MGIYKYVKNLWKKPKANMPELYRERLLAWRREDSTVKIDRPTRIDRARSLGYRSKQGFVVVRQRVLRGGHRKPQLKGGRRPKRTGVKLPLRKSYEVIAQERAQRKFANLAVLNSYKVMEDGKYYWYEIIFVDPSHPVIKADPKINWICKGKHRSRVFRGKTSAGKKSRGMRAKGKNNTKARPSRRAGNRRA
jgi:large subunit ribosomal protein L15e